jgi:hypothetical protein
MISIPFPVNGISRAAAAPYAKAAGIVIPNAFSGAVVDCAKGGSKL